MAPIGSSGSWPPSCVWRCGAVQFLAIIVGDLQLRALMGVADEPEPINVGTGQDLSIRDHAVMVQEIVGYEGQLVWDSTKPDGTPRKQLDTRKINALGWEPTISLENGIRSTYDWFLQHVEKDARL